MEEEKEKEEQKKTDEEAPVQSPDKSPTSLPTESPKSPEEKNEGKSKILWIGLIVIIAVIGIAGIYSFFAGSANQQAESVEQTSEEVAEDAVQTVKELQAEVEESSIAQIKCASSYIGVVSVQEDLVLIMNPSSTETITDIICTADNEETFSVDDEIIAGGIASAAFSRGDSTSIRCTGKCITIEVSGDCEEGQNCWEE